MPARWEHEAFLPDVLFSNPGLSSGRWEIVSSTNNPITLEKRPSISVSTRCREPERTALASSFHHHIHLMETLIEVFLGSGRVKTITCVSLCRQGRVEYHWLQQQAQSGFGPGHCQLLRQRSQFLHSWASLPQLANKPNTLGLDKEVRCRRAAGDGKHACIKHLGVRRVKAQHAS